MIFSGKYIHNREYILSLVALLIFIAGCINTPKTVDGKSVQLPSAPASAEIKVMERIDTNAVAAHIPDSVLSRLKGKWQRTDGDYVIEIFSITNEGKLDAGYFNPDPIKVHKAGWEISERKLCIRIILKDINYPGSTYSLIYNADNDCLSGNYFQAAEGMNFDVIFTRKI